MSMSLSMSMCISLFSPPPHSPAARAASETLSSKKVTGQERETKKERETEREREGRKTDGGALALAFVFWLVDPASLRLTSFVAEISFAFRT